MARGTKIKCLGDGISPCQDNFEVFQEEGSSEKSIIVANELIDEHIELNQDHELQVRIVFVK